MSTHRFGPSALATATLLLLSVHTNAAFAADAEAAKELARQNNCFKCHGIEKAKDGPSWHSVAEKMKGKPDAAEKLTTHLTTGPEVKFPDGHMEKHKILKADPADIKNLVDYILSL